MFYKYVKLSLDEYADTVADAARDGLFWEVGLSKWKRSVQYHLVWCAGWHTFFIDSWKNFYVGDIFDIINGTGITKEEIEYDFNDLVERIDAFEETLESVYQELVDKDYTMARKIEHLQFSDPYGMCYIKGHVKRIANLCMEVAEENEQIENLNEYLELKNKLERIKRVLGD